MALYMILSMILTHQIFANHDHSHLPKLRFPNYEGETTCLWISQAEDYFEIYSVPPYHWIKVSQMHFCGAVARWIESIHQLDRIPWPDFCKMLHDRFGRDQCNRLSHKMFHINQSNTILDYVERFSSLFDQLKAYQAKPDMHYYTNRFIGGLKHDIRIVVAIQHPSNLDTTYILALLQEEMAEAPMKSEFHGYDRGARTGFQSV